MKKFSPEKKNPDLQYPLLAKRQKASTVMERKVRRLLNEQTAQSQDEAWRILSAISPSKRGAEWYFLSGCLRYRLGHFTDTFAYLEKAVELSDGKIPEYQAMKDTLTQTSITLSPPTDQDPLQGIQPASRGSMFAGFMGECCTEGCCECLCEGCCEGLCDGCDCDCG